MKYTVAFLVSLFLLGITPGKAEETTLAWTRVDGSSWILDLTKTDRKEIVVLILVEDDIFLTSLINCKDTKISQTHSWKYGEKIAHGTGCYGERLQTTTEEWETYLLTFPAKEPPKESSPTYRYLQITFFQTPGFPGVFFWETSLSDTPSPHT
jgi:hypothetical protein